MPSADRVLAYAVASAILIVIPGPSVLFTVGRALAYGRRTALATVCGNVAGNYLVAACVAVGLGSLVQRSAQVFLAVKLAGAAYLVWLGVQAIRKRATLAEAFSPAVPARSDGRAAREGFLVGVTNPKSFILFGAVLPQFVDRTAGDVRSRCCCWR
jgi:threonine/homoserine/homoserine lactone efflux protein